MTDLFPLPESLSPKLAWLKKHLDDIARTTKVSKRALRAFGE